MIIHNVLLCRESKLKNVFFREPRKYLGSLTFTWEQRKLGEITTEKLSNGIMNHPSEEMTGVKHINVINMYTSDRIHIEDLTDSEYDDDAVKKCNVEIGDIFLTRSSVKPEGIAEANVLLDSGQYVYDDHLIRMKIDKCKYDASFVKICLGTPLIKKQFIMKSKTTAFTTIGQDDIASCDCVFPSYGEQKAIGAFFDDLDHLITLHQRECKYIKLEANVLSRIKETDLFCDYYDQWIKVYKEGAVRKVTMDKYRMTYSWLKRLAPSLRLCDVTRVTYQQILNNYAVCHERQTTMDFHHQLKGAIIDAVDDGLIAKDPTRKAIIKGKTPAAKKIKYLNQYELHTLLSELDLRGDINWDWLILLTAKTGMRFSEVLALTPNDFDFAHQMLLINKTWDYKGNGGFLPTKNRSSVRKIQIDWQTVIQFSELVKKLPPDKPIFVQKERVYNSTVNDILARHCQKANIPIISVHGLRHTHASLLLFAGVSIASVARRLGHSSMTTTQKTYLHIIQELENQDVDLVMRSLSGLS